MIMKIIENQINNVLQKLYAVKQGLENGEFDNITVAVDYIFSPAEIDMFTQYMHQFNVRSADDLINLLNQFNVNLDSEIQKIGKDLINNVIEYLTAEEEEFKE